MTFIAVLTALFYFVGGLGFLWMLSDEKHKAKRGEIFLAIALWPFAMFFIGCTAITDRIGSST